MATQLGVPIRGVNKGSAHGDVDAQFSPKMNNVRVKDVLAGRLRLGQRPGLAKWGAGTLIGGENQPVVAMCIVSTVQ